MRVNIEASLIAYLRSAGFRCWADRPDDPPDSYCLVDRTGGAYSDYIDRATVSVDCVSGTRAEACELAYAVDDAMPGFVAERGIMRVEKQSIQNLSHIVAGMDGLYRCVYAITSLDSPLMD